MEIKELIRKGIFSFVVGFIITIILGVVMAFISYLTGFQSFLFSGGIPLTWLYFLKEGLGIKLNLSLYDYFAFAMDIVFWTFVVFLIITRTKKEKSTKRMSVPSSGYFKEKLDGKEIRKISIISISIASIIVFITFFTFITGGSAPHPTGVDQIYDIKHGFPFPWYRTYQIDYGSPSAEVSNWMNLIFDIIIYLLIYFLIIFGIYYFVETLLKNRRLKKAK